MDPVALHNMNQISGLLWLVGAIVMNTENDDPTDSPKTMDWALGDNLTFQAFTSVGRVEIGLHEISRMQTSVDNPPKTCFNPSAQ